MKIAPGASPSEQDICFTARLDKTFQDLDEEFGPRLPWQYFGSQSGYHRQFPGAKRTNDYDPRVRPWYTGASSGPKDVVLVLDTSGSMTEAGRLDLMKQAAAAVLSSMVWNFVLLHFELRFS